MHFTSNKKFEAASFVLVTCLFVSGCSSSSSNDPKTLTQENSANASNQINHNLYTVKVVDTSGDVLADINVVYGDASATTNSEGVVQLDVAENENIDLTVSGSGYVKQQRSVTASDLGGGAKTITLQTRELTGTISAQDGGRVTHSATGTAVEVPADAFVDAAGQPVQGTVNAYITPVDTSRLESLRTAAGPFVGIPDDGSDPTAITSYGMADFTFETENGDEVDLANGQLATITISLGTDKILQDDGTLRDMAGGDTIPLWYYDYEQKSWVQEGSATVADMGVDNTPRFQAIGSVSHFTPWNCDARLPGQSTITWDISCPASPGDISVGTIVGGNIIYHFGRLSGPQSIYNGSLVAEMSRSQFVPGGELCYEITDAICDYPGLLGDEQFRQAALGAPYTCVVVPDNSNFTMPAITLAPQQLAGTD
ncbi:hypothetical protein AB833_10085 [Chromatiales bacterium (ex Bugula neritina AB1)]|nr:hypothetical protein AB833_10085 [Chromatiales bacterium (ex Bugula neritina AB1)]